MVKAIKDNREILLYVSSAIALSTLLVLIRIG